MWILGKVSHLGSRGARPARRGKRLAVGSRQQRRDIATWPQMQETDSPQLQETFMHRVSAIVHCTAVIQYNHNRNRVSLYYLFQENKSFGTHYHLHSSSDVREVVSSTISSLLYTVSNLIQVEDLLLQSLYDTPIQNIFAISFEYTVYKK